MLVLSRKSGQTIRISENIEVQMVRIKGGTVVVGIAAPRDVKVLRGELTPEKKRKAG